MHTILHTHVRLGIIHYVLDTHSPEFNFFSIHLYYHIMLYLFNIVVICYTYTTLHLYYNIHIMYSSIINRSKYKLYIYHIERPKHIKNF